MERLGTVERVAQGLAIVRGAGAEPRIGTEVVDEGLDDVGTVVDVFGPVEDPFVAVDPADGVNLATRIGDPLYVR